MNLDYAQYQINNKDTIIFGFKAEGSIGEGATINDIAENIDDGENKISYMHKVSDNVSVMTTNVTIDQILDNSDADNIKLKSVAELEALNTEALDSAQCLI